MRLAERALTISASPTLGIDAQAKRMAKEGIHVISFGVGEPDFDTPQNIKTAAEHALHNGKTKYTPVAGIEELKEAIVEKLKRENRLDYQPNQVVVSNGAKHSLYNAMQVLLNPGDEVILPAPYWVSYEEMIKLTGAVAKVIQTTEADDFKLRPQMLEAAVSPRTKLIILNSPNNPTGAVYSREELEQLGEVIAKHNITVIADEIYEKLIYDGQEHISIAELSPELKELTILINGLSKAYSMTGWRIGYAVAVPAVAKAMSDFQSHSTSNANSFAQWASIEALKGDQSSVAHMSAEFARRRNYMVERLNAMTGIHCNRPGGAFYVFPNVAGTFGKRYRDILIRDASDLAAALLVEGRVAVVPGNAFGVRDFMRMSYATSLENIIEGLTRIESFLAELE